MTSGGADWAPDEPSEGATLQRKPLGAQIAASLRRDIYFGRLLPGTRLSQQELCERFDTSRMPVRDALRELVYAGLLEQDGRRHAVVASLNRADLIDSFLIEGMLSGLAARRATEVATPEDIDELDRLHKRMQKAGAERSPEMASLNWQFHRLINRLSGSRKIMAALRLVSLDVPRDYLTEFPEWTEKSNDEHEQIIKAMRAGDSERVERLMIDHLVESGIGLSDYLEGKGLKLD